MMKKRRKQKKNRDLYVVLIIAGVFIVFCGRAYFMKQDNIAYMGDGMQETYRTVEDQKSYKPQDKVMTMEDYARLTLKDDLIQGEIPILYQWDARWKDYPYGDGFIELKGCGPTCLSMVASHLLNDETLTPVKLAQESENWGYVGTYAGTSWELMTEGAQKLGLISEELPLDESKMRNALSDGKIIICAMGPGDFTDEGHFIVIVGYDTQKGGFIIHDPNSVERTKEVWPYSVLEWQIRNIWSLVKM